RPCCPFFFFFYCSVDLLDLHSFPTRRSSDLFYRIHFAAVGGVVFRCVRHAASDDEIPNLLEAALFVAQRLFGRSLEGGESHVRRSEEHTSELQSRGHLVCRLLLEKKKKK